MDFPPVHLPYFICIGVTDVPHKRKAAFSSDYFVIYPWVKVSRLPSFSWEVFIKATLSE